MKRAAKRIIIILSVIVVVLGIYVAYVFKAYYRLPDKLTLEVKRSGENNTFKEDFRVSPGGAYFIMTYNIGFGAYQKDYSFFMDGGKSSWGKDKESVMAAVCGMGEIVSTGSPMGQIEAVWRLIPGRRSQIPCAEAFRYRSPSANWWIWTGVTPSPGSRRKMESSYVSTMCTLLPMGAVMRSGRHSFPCFMRTWFRIIIRETM